MAVKMTDAEKIARLQLSAMALLWGSLNPVGRATAERIAREQGKGFGRLYATYPGETMVEKLGNAYAVIPEVYGCEYESTVGKDRSTLNTKKCKVKLEILPRVAKLVGEPVLESMCAYCKIMFPISASVNNCNLDIELTETGCKWTVTSK